MTAYYDALVGAAKPGDSKVNPNLLAGLARPKIARSVNTLSKISLLRGQTDTHVLLQLYSVTAPATFMYL